VPSAKLEVIPARDSVLSAAVLLSNEKGKGSHKIWSENQNLSYDFVIAVCKKKNGKVRASERF